MIAGCSVATIITVVTIESVSSILFLTTSFHPNFYPHPIRMLPAGRLSPPPLPLLPCISPGLLCWQPGS